MLSTWCPKCQHNKYRKVKCQICGFEEADNTKTYETYKIGKPEDYSTATFLFNFEKEPHIVEIGVLEGLMKKIDIISTRVGGQDEYISIRNNMIFELLMTRGLVEFSYQFNSKFKSFIYYDKVFYFVKDAKIVHSELIVL